MARREPAAGGPPVLLARDLPGSGSHFRGPEVELPQAVAIDGRNDGQMVFYDQVIPGSTLMGYVNADHWAIALPIARSHERIGTWFVTENAYPREALTEAVMRFVEEDLAGQGGLGESMTCEARHSRAVHRAACLRALAAPRLRGSIPSIATSPCSRSRDSTRSTGAASIDCGPRPARGTKTGCAPTARTSRRASRPTASTGRRCRRSPATTPVRARRCSIPSWTSDWILAVADVAAQFKLDLSRIAEGAGRQAGRSGHHADPRHPPATRERGHPGRTGQCVARADIRLQRADPEYATRAGSNNAHFLLARPTADFSPSSTWTPR